MFVHSYNAGRAGIRMQQMGEMVEKTNGFVLTYYRQHNHGPLSRSLSQRVNQRDAFLNAMEAQAEAIEEQIWQEFMCKKIKRMTR